MPPPQRSARLYQALVDTRTAPRASAARSCRREQPFLYYHLGDGAEGQPLDAVEDACSPRSIASRADGMTERNCRRRKKQLRARFVFESDSITNIAHQLGYFETIGRWQTYQR